MDDWVNEGVVEYLGVADDVKPYLPQPIVWCCLPIGRGATLSAGAAAMGKPIVTTDAVGCRDTVDDGLNGLLCRVADANDLADKLLQLMEMPSEERARMGLAGEKKWNFSLMRRSLLIVICALLRRSF